MTVIQRYDTNGDNILQQEEWEKMSGTPRAIDRDGDGQITQDELVWFLAIRGQGNTIHRTVVVDLSEPYRFNPADMRMFRPVWHGEGTPAVSRATTQESTTEDTTEEMLRTNEQPIDDDVYQRLLEEHQIPVSRPFHVLPENLRGVPKWFILLDRDGDGQISLVEFASPLTLARLRLFQRLDKNNDGLIVPNEVR